MWIVKQQHKRDDGESVAIELEHSDGWMDANVRWDGCMEIHLRTKTEEGHGMTGTVHTCDIDGLIEKLQQVKQISQEYFDFKGYWQRHTTDEAEI
ncbi:hypothetical protein [Effusibacillus pohliae]|uniref:hypothetical protein n=1 Tax=Effusibacillus pohliae TaxID=232270 RepID=UPI000364B864|nr:hypothetical protein [Effusibacillus pohliae]